MYVGSYNWIHRSSQICSKLSVARLIIFEDTIQNLLSMLLYGVYFFDPQLTTHQAKYNDPIKKSNRTTPAYLRYIFNSRTSHHMRRPKWWFFYSLWWKSLVLISIWLQKIRKSYIIQIYLDLEQFKNLSRKILLLTLRTTSSNLCS